MTPMTGRSERVRQGAHGAIDDLSHRVLPLIDRLSRRSHALVVRTAIRASDAAEAIVRGRINASIIRRAAAGRSREFVRDHPLSSILLAVVAGAVLYGGWRSRRAR